LEKIMARFARPSACQLVLAVLGLVLAVAQSSTAQDSVKADIELRDGTKVSLTGIYVVVDSLATGTVNVRGERLATSGFLVSEVRYRFDPADDMSPWDRAIALTDIATIKVEARDPPKGNVRSPSDVDSLTITTRDGAAVEWSKDKIVETDARGKRKALKPLDPYIGLYVGGQDQTKRFGTIIRRGRSLGGTLASDATKHELFPIWHIKAVSFVNADAQTRAPGPKPNTDSKLEAGNRDEAQAADKIATHLVSGILIGGLKPRRLCAGERFAGYDEPLEMKLARTIEDVKPKGFSQRTLELSAETQVFQNVILVAALMQTKDLSVAEIAETIVKARQKTLGEFRAAGDKTKSMDEDELKYLQGMDQERAKSLVALSAVIAKNVAFAENQANFDTLRDSMVTALLKDAKLVADLSNVPAPSDDVLQARARARAFVAAAQEAAKPNAAPPLGKTEQPQVAVDTLVLPTAGMTGLYVNAICGRGCDQPSGSCNVYIVTEEQFAARKPDDSTIDPSSARQTPLLQTDIRPGRYRVAVEARIDQRVVPRRQVRNVQTFDVEAFFSDDLADVKELSVRSEPIPGRNDVFAVEYYFRKWYPVAVEAGVVSPVVAIFVEKKASLTDVAQFYPKREVFRLAAAEHSRTWELVRQSVGKELSADQKATILGLLQKGGRVVLPDDIGRICISVDASGTIQVHGPQRPAALSPDQSKAGSQKPQNWPAFSGELQGRNEV
jgi:hypothetical protein